MSKVAVSAQKKKQSLKKARLGGRGEDGGVCGLVLVVAAGTAAAAQTDRPPLSAKGQPPCKALASPVKYQSGRMQLIQSAAFLLPDTP